MSDFPQRGHCLCGEVRFEIGGEPNWVAHCHCESCRRATSAAFATYAGYAHTAVTWSGAPRSEYVSSLGVVRSFCPQCGSPMSFQSERWPGEIHLFAASFDHPHALRPEFHEHADEKLDWVHLADGLPWRTKDGDDPAADLKSAAERRERP